MHLDGGSSVETLERVVSLVLLELKGSVLVKELIDGEVASSDSNVNLVLVHSDGDALGSELVDTITLTHEHDLELLSIGEVVDVLSESLINGISLNRDVNGNAGLQVNDVLLKSLDLELSVLKVLEDIDGSLRALEVLGFEGRDVFSSGMELILKGSVLG